MTEYEEPAKAKRLHIAQGLTHPFVSRMILGDSDPKLRWTLKIHSSTKLSHGLEWQSYLIRFPECQKVPGDQDCTNSTESWANVWLCNAVMQSSRGEGGKKRLQKPIQPTHPSRITMLQKPGLIKRKHTYCFQLLNPQVICPSFGPSIHLFSTSSALFIV